MHELRWDIFCKIVDNLGDIGVCWRLARQLHMEHGLQVRLWIDDLSVARRVIPALDVTLQKQVVQDITIISWHANTVFNQAAEVVIEAFGCELPPAYLDAMSQKRSKWVNLEYLSAEPWVGDFHAKPSPRPQHNLTRHFYFPGFTEATGGLIRERNIVEQNQLLTNDMQLQDAFWKRLNLTRDAYLKVSLFYYPHAPVYDLLTIMASGQQTTDCYVPASSDLQQIARFFGKDAIAAGDNLTHKNLNLHVLPFLSHQDYDQLLAVCDINFVRGEDSWIRAIWAGKPFIWQPYFQTENTHMKKLDAFLEVFYGHSDAKQVACEAHRYWSAGHMPETAWNHFLNALPALRHHARQQAQQLAKQADLASKLVIFCNKIQ